MFRKLDADGNGAIDFAEFKAGVQREPLLVEAFLAPVRQGSLAPAVPKARKTLSQAGSAASAISMGAGGGKAMEGARGGGGVGRLLVPSSQGSREMPPPQGLGYAAAAVVGRGVAATTTTAENSLDAVWGGVDSTSAAGAAPVTLSQALGVSSIGAMGESSIDMALAEGGGVAFDPLVVAGNAEQQRAPFEGAGTEKEHAASEIQPAMAITPTGELLGRGGARGGGGGVAEEDEEGRSGTDKRCRFDDFERGDGEGGHGEDRIGEEELVHGVLLS